MKGRIFILPSIYAEWKWRGEWIITCWLLKKREWKTLFEHWHIWYVKIGHLAVSWGMPLKQNRSLHWQTPATRGQEAISVTMRTYFTSSLVNWTKTMSLPLKNPSSLEHTADQKTIYPRGRLMRPCAEERGCRWWGTFSCNEKNVHSVECVLFKSAVWLNMSEQGFASFFILDKV